MESLVAASTSSFHARQGAAPGGGAKRIPKRPRDHDDEDDDDDEEWEDHVEINYRGQGQWYPGRISRVVGDGTYDVLYDDGETETGVASSLIRQYVHPSADGSRQGDKKKREDMFAAGPRGLFTGSFSAGAGSSLSASGAAASAAMMGSSGFASGRLAGALMSAMRAGQGMGGFDALSDFTALAKATKTFNGGSSSSSGGGGGGGGGSSEKPPREPREPRPPKVKAPQEPKPPKPPKPQKPPKPEKAPKPIKPIKPIKPVKETRASKGSLAPTTQVPPALPTDMRLFLHI
jgi:hypothetical protein